MHNTKIIQLGPVRQTKELLAEWERVRACIQAGEVIGFHTALMGADDRESIFIGGTYRHDPEASVRTVLKVSAFRMLEDEPA